MAEGNIMFGSGGKAATSRGGGSAAASAGGDSGGLVSETRSAEIVHELFRLAKVDMRGSPFAAGLVAELGQLINAGGPNAKGS